MSIAALLALSLTLPAQAKAEDFPDKPYTVRTQGTTTKLKAGTPGVFALQILPNKGFKVSREAPLKIKLKSDGVALKKSKLGQKDAHDKKSAAPKFRVEFQAESAGEKSIAAKAVFFVCSEKICQRKTAKLNVAVNVTN